MIKNAEYWDDRYHREKNDNLTFPEDYYEVRLQWAMAKEPDKYGCQLQILFPLCCADLKLDYYDRPGTF